MSLTSYRAAPPRVSIYVPYDGPVWPQRKSFYDVFLVGTSSDEISSWDFSLPPGTGPDSVG